MAKLLNMGDGKNQPKNQKVNPNAGGGKKVSIKQSKPVDCATCGYDIYVNAVHLRKIPKVIVGSPQDVLIPVEVFMCGNCGEVNKELLPAEVKPFFNDKEETEEQDQE